jgi:hypothetical protein
VSAESIHAAENPNQIKSAPRFSAFIPLGRNSGISKSNYSQYDFSSGKPFFSPMCFSLVNAASTERTAIEGK